MSEDKKTFRDFAGHVMSGDVASAGSVLEQLLELDASAARAAATHFHARFAAEGPAFMGKAMGLRTVKDTGSEAELAALLVDLFGLADPLVIARAVAAMRRA